MFIRKIHSEYFGTKPKHLAIYEENRNRSQQISSVGSIKSSVRIYLFSIVLFFIYNSPIQALDYVTEKNVPYVGQAELAQADAYQKERWCFDVKYPKGGKDLPVLIWFHGGGLSSGMKNFPLFYESCKTFQQSGLVIITANYRLYPKVDFPVFIEDAATVVGWVYKNVVRYGGSSKKIFVSGGSAGGYLTAMLGMDPRWLKKVDLKPTDLCGILPVSGQMTTHFNVKKWLKYPGEQYQPVIDENAPLGHLNAKEIPPTFLIVGDRKIEWKARVQENELLFASLSALGHPLVEFSESPGIGHGISGMNLNMNTIDPELADRIDDFFIRALDFKSKKK